MAVEKKFSAEQQKVSLSERLWLAYFNHYLYEHGMITESQRNRMAVKIDSRKESTGKGKQQDPREL